jgi:putative endonuclease
MGSGVKNDRGLYTTNPITVIPDIAGNDFPRRRESKSGAYPRCAHLTMFIVYRMENVTIPLRSHGEIEMDKSSYVYILTSEPYGILYIGVTSNLIKRVWQHREGVVEGFSKQYGVKQLVWFEVHSEIVEAITREKQIKKWNRNWKVNLIQESNPDWRDLFDEIAT